MNENVNKINQIKSEIRDRGELELENRHNLLESQHMNLGINGGVDKEIVKMNNEMCMGEGTQKAGKKKGNNILRHHSQRMMYHRYHSGMVSLLYEYVCE